MEQAAAPSECPSCGYVGVDATLPVEKGRTGRQVQQVHQALAVTGYPLLAMAPVDAHDAGTAADVLAQIPHDGLVASVNSWPARVWRATTLDHVVAAAAGW